MRPAPARSYVAGTPHSELNSYVQKAEQDPPIPSQEFVHPSSKACSKDRRPEVTQRWRNTRHRSRATRTTGPLRDVTGVHPALCAPRPRLHAVGLKGRMLPGVFDRETSSSRLNRLHGACNERESGSPTTQCTGDTGCSVTPRVSSPASGSTPETTELLTPIDA